MGHARINNLGNPIKGNVTPKTDLCLSCSILHLFANNKSYSHAPSCQKAFSPLRTNFLRFILADQEHYV